MYNFEIPETIMIRKENTTSDDHSKIFKPSSSSSSKTWSRSNDPRIVRVSRAFGGKDRHSKVFTVKGLRDRRIRLSVPTAVYIYDLQERLGLNQPSKVVDWLLKAAKDDIDELPPLQIPPGIFCNNGHQVSSSSSHQDFIRSSHEKQAVLTLGGGINWLNPGSNTGSGFLNPTTAVPYNPHLKWDPSNLTLSQYPQKNQTLSEDLPTFNLVQLPYTTVSVPSGSQQVLLYQPAGISQSFFNSHVSAMDAEFVHKNQIFQGLQLSNFPNILQSQNSPRNERNKDVGFHLQ